MNKKGYIELSIGTIVIIVLAMTMLILGMVLVKNIFSFEKINITKEECIEHPPFTFNGKEQKLFITPLNKNLGERHIFTFKDSNESMIYVEYEVCKDIEVEVIQ